MQKFVITLILVLSLPFVTFAQKRVDWNKKVSETGKSQQSDFAVSNRENSGVESFDGADFPPTGWQKFTKFGGTGWQRTTVGAEVPGFQGAPSVDAPQGGGSFVAMASWLTGDADSLLNTGQPTDQWLITSQIEDVQAGDSLTFHLKYFSTFGDNLDILISTATPADLDSSLVDTAVVPIDSLFTIPVDTLIFTGASSNDWIRYGYRLADFVETGSNIFIAFRERVGNTSNEGDALFLDLVALPSQVTSVSESPGVPRDFALHQNFPNPFNPSTNISFSLPKNLRVTLTIHNLLGQEVATLLKNTPFTQGTHTIQFETSNLPSGVYFYRISAGEFSQIRKMTLLK